MTFYDDLDPKTQRMLLELIQWTERIEAQIDELLDDQRPRDTNPKRPRDACASDRDAEDDGEETPDGERPRPRVDPADPGLAEQSPEPGDRRM